MSMDTLGSIRSSITPRQQKLLDLTWAHVREKNIGIPERPLLEAFGRTALNEEVNLLGRKLIYSNHEEGRLRFSISVLGIFLTSDGPRIEKLVATYLKILRDAYLKNPDIELLASKDIILAAPHLTSHELNDLRLVIYAGNGLFASRVSGWNQDGWTAFVENEVIDLRGISDLAAFVRTKVASHYASESRRHKEDTKSRTNLNDPFESSSLLGKRLLTARGSGKAPADNKRTSLRLHFMKNDAALRKIIASDWREAQRHLSSRAWKSCILLCGGIVEGLLLWQLENARLSTISANDNANSARYDAETLSGIIRHSLEKGLITRDEEQLMTWAKMYRNIIHPGNQRREGRSPSRRHAELASHMVLLVAQNIRDRASGTR